MIYKFIFGLAIAFFLSTVSFHNPLFNLLGSLYISFPVGIVGWTLLVFRIGVGFLFVIHGSPKITHLRLWASSLKMPVFLCLLSALSMLLGGICLIFGFLTPLASVAILASMAFAMLLEILQGSPFVAADPYLIPDDQYKGPKGKGEPPSWEKAFMYCLMLIAIIALGPGAYSIDALIFGK